MTPNFRAMSDPESDLLKRAINLGFSDEMIHAMTNEIIAIHQREDDIKWYDKIDFTKQEQEDCDVVR